MRIQKKGNSWPALDIFVNTNLWITSTNIKVDQYRLEVRDERDERDERSVCVSRQCFVTSGASPGERRKFRGEAERQNDSTRNDV